MREKVIKGKAITKVLSCFVVIVFLMSTFSVAVIATDSANSTASNVNLNLNDEANSSVESVALSNNITGLTCRDDLIQININKTETVVNESGNSDLPDASNDTYAKLELEYANTSSPGIINESDEVPDPYLPVINDTDIDTFRATAKTVSSMSSCSYVWIKITDKYCYGYKVYVDGVYQFTEGESGTPDGYCSFKVTPGYHTFKLTLNGKEVSKGWNCQCGVVYNWMSMNDMIPHWCEDGGNDNPTDEYEVKFQGIVTSTTPSEYDCGFKDVYICEVQIEKVVFGDYFEKGNTVNIVYSQWRENAHACGTYDKVSVGDTVEVYGEMIPIYCVGTWITICGKSSYYLKKIDSGSLSIDVWTADAYKNTKTEFKPEDNIYIWVKTNRPATIDLIVDIYYDSGGHVQKYLRDDKRLSAANEYYNVWTAGEPGRRVLTLKAWDDHGIYAEDKWTFYVKGTKTVSSDIKFAGTVIEPDNGYLDDLFDCKVKIDRIITDPGNIDIKEGDEVLIEKFIFCDPGGTVDEWYVKVDDSVEVYGKISKGDFSLSGHSDSSFLVDLCGSSSYYFIQKELSRPDPEITKVTYPTMCVKESEDATISVTVENNGGTSSEGYISVSFPNDETISNVYGTGDGYNKLIPKGSTIWGKYSQMTSYDPLVELEEFQWGKDQQEKITMSVKPNSGSDKIVFYVRAALKNDADGSYERDPTYSGNKDQQGWYVKKYEIAVCQEKPAPEIIKVTYPSTCVTEDEETEISVTVKNNGGTSSEGYISVSFPNDETISNVYGTGDGYNKLIPKGSTIWDKNGQMTSYDPLVELEEFQWGKDQQEKITMSVKPNSGSDKIVFYVRAALKNDADGSYERDPSYSGNKDQQGWYVKKYSVDVCAYEEVKFRGKILADYQWISFHSFDVKIDKVLDDPTGNLQEGKTVNVYGHRDGPAQVDDVTVGDEVKVFGEYRGYEGTYEQIFLSDWDESSSNYYVKMIELSFELISPDLTSELELYKTHNIPIKVKSATTKGGTIVASLIFTSKFGNPPREEIINLKDDDFDGIYEYDYSLEPFEQMAMDSIDNSVKTKDAEALYNSICDYFSSTIGTYNLTLKYYDASSEKAEYLDMQSSSIQGTPYLPGLGWKWQIEKFINDNTFQPPSVQMWGGHWTTLEEVQEGMVETVLYLSEDNEGTAYLDLALQCTGPIGLIYGLTLSNCLREAGHEDKADESLHKTLAGFVIELTPVGWVKTFYDVANDLAIIFKGEKIFIIRSECPVNLHMYDSSNNHVGLDEYGNPETEIPYSIYTQDENGDFEGILIIDFNSDDFYEVVIEGTGNGKFNLTSEIIGQDKKQEIAYLNVPVYTNTIAEIDISSSNPDYTMKIDEDGDGTPEYEKKPDSIETIGCTYDHDGDGIVEDDIDDLIMATDAYLGFNTGSEYDADGDGIVEDDIDDLIMATDAYLGFITCEGED